MIFIIQTKDDIRYPLVTGVQTCALPICKDIIEMASRESSNGGLNPAAAGVPDLSSHAPDTVYRPVQRQFSNIGGGTKRSEEHTSELQSRVDLVCRLLLEKKNEHVT